MNVLILGSGGREHAVYQKLQQSPHIDKLFIAPGNAGIENDFRFHDIALDDFTAILQKIKSHNIDLVFVGPEQPLVAGIVDFLQKELPNLAVFGPNKNAAQLEGSKIFAAEFIKKANLPVCKSEAANSLEQAKELLKTFSLPVVIKADGLAAGKGVSIHEDYTSALQTLDDIFTKKIFGENNSAVLLQEFMRGTEASLFVLMNGEEGIFLPTAQDYKAAFDNGQGPNTGGMGSVSPGTALNQDHIDSINRSIVKKVAERFHYQGILYIGLMIHSPQADDYSIVEFNCRLGDPETQCVLPMLETDLFPYLLWACHQENKLPQTTITRIQEKNYYRMPTKPGFAINVVVAAKNYPAEYEKNIPLQLPQKLPEHIHIVHAGTKRDTQGNLFSTGGRILSVVAQGKNLTETKKDVYDVLEQFRSLNDFTRLRFRSDIGKL